MKENYLFKKVEIYGYESMNRVGSDSCLSAEMVVMTSAHSLADKEEFEKVCAMVDSGIIDGQVYNDKTIVIPVSITALGKKEFDMAEFEAECSAAKNKYKAACERFGQALKLQGAVDIYRSMVSAEK